MVDCDRYASRPLISPQQSTLTHAGPSFADFITEHPEHLAPNNAMNYLSDNGGASYNLCHCAFVSPYSG